MATKANPPKGPISNLPAGPEHRQRSSNQFCRCGHARSFTLQGLRHICRDPKCECVKHDTAVTPPKAKLSVVETPAPIANGIGIDPVTGEVADGPYDSEATEDDETPAPDTTLPIDGNVLDRVLLAGALEHQNEAIEAAKRHLVTGLRSQRAGMPKFATECFAAALAALGNLGAS